MENPEKIPAEYSASYILNAACKHLPTSIRSLPYSLYQRLREVGENPTFGINFQNNQKGTRLYDQLVRVEIKGYFSLKDGNSSQDHVFTFSPEGFIFHAKDDTIKELTKEDIKFIIARLRFLRWKNKDNPKDNPPVFPPFNNALTLLANAILPLETSSLPTFLYDTFAHLGIKVEVEVLGEQDSLKNPVRLELTIESPLDKNTFRTYTWAFYKDGKIQQFLYKDKYLSTYVSVDEVKNIVVPQFIYMNKNL